MEQQLNKNYFVKSHGLGNDYIVLDDSNLSFELTPQAIKRICDVHYGIGSDGILLSVSSNTANFGLRIFNPDGSEAEKSGNGLRIFCKYLFDYGFTGNRSFSVETLGGIVNATIDKVENYKATVITIDMGKAIFEAQQIPVKVNTPLCLEHKFEVGGITFEINCVSVGNPHCVIINDKITIPDVLKFGPVIEKHTLFPNRINVQFVKIISPTEVEILIWERGAGYTLASGSSSCAVAAVLYKLGKINNNVTVSMPGGSLAVSIDNDYNIKLTGEVRQICEGQLSEELIEDLRKGE